MVRARLRRRLAESGVIGLVLVVGGCAFLPGIVADPGHPGDPLRIVAPASGSQLASSAGVPLRLAFTRAVDRSSVRVVLYTGTDFTHATDLTRRLVLGEGRAALTLGPADIEPGESLLVARAHARHGGRHFDASAAFSYEPAIDVSLARRCEFLGQDRCQLPFPDDWFTVLDPSTSTGRRVHFDPASMPANSAGTPVDPTEWNRNDGFSPGSPIVLHVPGVDLAETGAVPITNIGESLDRDQPIVIIDAQTGRRWPFFAELDAIAPDDAHRALFIRPARNFLEGHRYIVALRDLKDASGHGIPASRVFQVYRDRIPTFLPAVEARRPHVESVLARLAAAGVGRKDLYLAWDFTVASERSLSARVLHIRDDAFASLHGGVPGYTITGVQDDVDADVLRRVTGTFQVPLYLTGTGAPGARFQYATRNPGPNALPVRNGTFDANFICDIPRSATTAGGDPVVPARPLVYGHGLLGSAREVNSFGALANRFDIVMCATDWIGMSQGDLGNVAGILQDLSKFPSLADRVQQGFVNFQFLARLLKDPRGFAADAAFRFGASSTPVIKTGEVFFNGNSQGGILGGAATAISTEWTRAVLGVPAMNFSTLLTRSVDWTPFSSVNYTAYPDALTRAIGFAQVQMLWDRSEADGYALHMTTDPLRDTPEHHVLLEEAFGDHQVTNIATETEARTIGAHVYQPALAAGRDTAVVPFWDVPAIGHFPSDGNVLVMWDYGTPAPPTTNTPNTAGVDPHGLGHGNPKVAEQVSNWLRPDGFFVDLCGGQPCRDLSP